MSNVVFTIRDWMYDAMWRPSSWILVKFGLLERECRESTAATGSAARAGEVDDTKVPPTNITE